MPSGTSSPAGRLTPISGDQALARARALSLRELCRATAAPPRRQPLQVLKLTQLKVAALQVSTLACGFLLGPGIAQTDRSAENRFPRLGVPIEAKIALPFELHRFLELCVVQRRLEAPPREHLERVRIEIRFETFTAAWIGPREQRIVEPDLCRARMLRGHPMDCRLHFAAIGCIAAAGRGIIGATQLRHLAF